jgi:hypothetical protein
MRHDPVEIALLLVGGIGPIFLLIRLLVARKCVYATWAKFAYVLASVAGLAWLIIGFVILEPQRLTPHSFSLMLAVKYLCAGMIIGFTPSVIIARPCRKAPATHVPLDASQQT